MASLGVKGGIAGMAQVATPTAVPQARGGVSNAASSLSIDFGSPSTWVAVIFGASILYLAGAYIMLG
ncbi:MAG: hypothetical protein ACRDRL_16300, partial [Sciscionella sp.]